MGRILLILIAACLIATFMIISNSSFTTNIKAPKKEEETGKKAEKDRPMKRAQDSRAKIARKGAPNRAQSYNANDSTEGPVGVVVMEAEENGQDPGDAHATVRGDYTPVYSGNSRGSSILKLLKKGDRVATDLEVTDGQAKWTIVKKGDLTRPGFVLDENLQRASTTKKTENRK